MIYKIILLVVSLLLTTCAEQQEVVLINKLNNFFNFDHNIFLMDSSSDINRFINTKQHWSTLTPQTLLVFQNVDKNITGLEMLKEIKSKRTFLIVVIEDLYFDKKLDLLARIKDIQRFKIDIKIGIFSLRIVQSDDLHQSFEWFWKHRIINVFVACSYSDVLQESTSQQLLNIFTYNPFGTFKVINVTNDNFDNFFLKQNSNFQQHPLRVGTPYPSLNSDNKKLWKVIFDVLNASMIRTQGPESNISVLARSQLFDNDTMDIVMFLYANNEVGSEDKPINMYPMIIDNFVLLVPAAEPYSGFETYLRATFSEISFAYLSVTVVSIMLILSFFRYIKYKKNLVFQSIADVINLLMNKNSDVKYQKLCVVEILLIVPLTFIGIAFMNGMLSTLQSYLTRPYIQRQINTLEDIYSSPLHIYTDNPLYAKNLITVLNQLKHGNWHNKVRVTNTNDFFRQIRHFNTSISFLWPNGRARTLLEYQKRLNVRGYHISKLQIFKYVGSYPVSDDFPFVDRFNEIINRIRSSGLYGKWWRENVSKFIKSEVLKRVDFVSTSNETKRFSVPIFIIYGWCISIIVLVFEIIWKNIKLRRMTNRIKKKRTFSFTQNFAIKYRN